MLRGEPNLEGYIYHPALLDFIKVNSMFSVAYQPDVKHKWYRVNMGLYRILSKSKGEQILPEYLGVLLDTWVEIC